MSRPTAFRRPRVGRRRGGWLSIVPRRRRLVVFFVLIIMGLMAGWFERLSPTDGPGAASAEGRVQGRVVRVHDGDTLSLAADDGQTVKIRLFGLDAPEMDQPYGAEARRFLAGRLAGRRVAVEEYDRDQYGRLVGRVFLENQPVDREMISQGWAWVYAKYCLAPHCRELRAGQAAARQKRLGLWQGQKPVAPWVWRWKRR